MKNEDDLSKDSQKESNITDNSDERIACGIIDNIVNF
jgi:hypothetical protein